MNQKNNSLLFRLRYYLFDMKLEEGSRLQFLLYRILSSLETKLPFLKCTINAIFGRIGEKRFVVRNDIGAFEVRLADDSLGKSSPGFESESHGFLEVHNRKVFIDVGANAGFFTILALNRYNFAKSYCFEPNPSVFRRLQANMSLNGLQNRSSLHNRALGSGEDTLLFCRDLVRTGRSRFVDKVEASKLEKNSNFSVESIRTQTFEGFLAEHNLPVEDIGFIKIDVEGFEYQVLLGMRGILKRVQNARILVEIWKEGDDMDNVMALLEDAGFELTHQIAQNYIFDCNRSLSKAL